MSLPMSIDDILAHRDRMLFTNVTLRRPGASGDVVYQGTGVLEQQQNGRLSIQITLTLPISINNIFQGMNESRAGQIIRDDAHFSIEAICDDGTVWSAEHVLPEGHQINLVSGLGTVYVRPKFLTTSITLSAARVGTLRTFVVEGKLPLRLNPFILSNEVAVEIESNDQRTEVKLAHDGNVEQSCARHLSNALDVLSGQRNKWLCDAFERNDRIEVTIWSFGRDEQAHTLPTPLPNHYEANAYFIARFVAHGDALGKFIDHWMSIYNAWQSSSAMAALPLSVSIEGLVNTYFPDLKVEGDDAIAAAAAAVEAIQRLDVSDVLKQRLVGSVSNIGRGSVPRALRVLVEQGLLTQVLFSSYGSVRNRAAHAVDEEYGDPILAQSNVDKIFSCLSLFYRLLLIRLEYEGPVVEHSLHGCPVGTFTLPLRADVAVATQVPANVLPIAD